MLKINSASKSRLRDYDTCPLMAYEKLRKTEPMKPNKNMDIGSLAHELSYVQLSEFSGIPFESRNIEERFPIDVIDTVYEMLTDRDLSIYYKDIQIMGIEESVSINVPGINAENEPMFVLNGRFDIVSTADIDDQRYIVVDDLKGGAAVKKDTDIEAIVYAIAAYEKYGGLPVIFRRISLGSRMVHKETFSVARIKRLIPILKFKMKEYKVNMESEMIPEYIPGDHCVSCDNLEKCQGRKIVHSLQHKVKAAEWAKQYAKVKNKEVEAAVKEYMQNKFVVNSISDGSTHEALPFLNGKFGASINVSSTWQLKGRSFKKADVLKLLAETGDLEDLIAEDLVSFKLNESIAKKLSEEYKIPTHEVYRTTVSLEPVNTMEDEDNDLK